MTSPTSWHQEEKLLWAVLKNFETLALQQYRQFAPELGTLEKQNFVAKLEQYSNGGSELKNSSLAQPVKNLMASAKGDSEMATLVGQGLLLELLGTLIYASLEKNPKVSPLTQELAQEGKNISHGITASVPESLALRYSDKDVLFDHFINASQDILRGIDVLGEALDQIYSEKYGIYYADIIAEFGAELIQACVEMGIDRQKLMCHLTACLMGL